MPTFAVQYTYDDRSTERDEIRPAHRRFLATLLDAGTLLASGPYTGPSVGSQQTEAEGALLLLSADSTEAVQAVLDEDPFAHAGLVAERSIRPWSPVFGPWA
ncbi:MAG TPA: YciI family protein [Actinotalea sp.]|jgi:hypothetical protein